MRILIYALLTALLIGLTPTIPPAQAQEAACQLEISGNDAIQYDKKELKAGGSCKEITLTLTHTGKLPATAMGHDWVLTRPADMNGVVQDGLTAGPANNYVKPGDSRVIAATPIVGGGQSTTIKFSTAALKKGESYTYVCTFPGHSGPMHGTLTFG